MNLLELILREIGHHKANFCLGTGAVCVAAGCVVAELTFLHRHRLRDEQVLEAKVRETDQKMKELEDDYRKITKGLGFNVLILPADQDLGELFANDFGTRTMPEAYVQRLATNRVVTIQHLLPSLQQKLKWEEFGRTIILVGVRGEVPILQASPKAPILEAVPPHTMTVGYALHRALQLKLGQKVRLLGHDFAIGKLQPERGGKDDLTVWINLKEAQELLDKPSQVNGILALECVCAADSVQKVRAEIGRILPDTQVIVQSHAVTRAEARQRAAKEATEAMGREKANRAQLRQSRERLAAILVPVVVLGAGLWIAFLSYGNVCERRSEIGILRALGLRSRQLLVLFLGRALVMGATGAALGLTAGLLVAADWHEPTALTKFWLDPGLLAGVLAGAPLVAMLAGWLPACLAARHDPAQILNQD